MKLFINKTQAANRALCTSLTQLTSIAMQPLTLADNLPLEIYIADGLGDAAAESGDDTDWTIRVGIGYLGSAPLAFTEDFSTVSAPAGWAGELSLATAELAAAVAAGSSDRMYFEVELTGPDDVRRTYLQVPVQVNGQVIDGETFPGAALPNAVLAPLSLISTRVPFADSSGRLVDSTKLSFASAAGRLALGGYLGMGIVAAPTSPVAGDVWHQSGEGLRGWMLGRTTTFTGKLATQTALQTFTNSTNEQTMFGTIGQGNLTLPANFFAAGVSVLITMFGTQEHTTGTVTLRVKLGSTTIATITGTPAAPFDRRIKIEALITCRSAGSSGSVVCALRYDVSGTAIASGGTFMQSAESTTINTTTQHILDVTGQFGTADVGNVFGVSFGLVEVK